MIKQREANSWKSVSYAKSITGAQTYTKFPIVLRTTQQSIPTWNAKGNTETSGTPSPSSPITINGVGERTENLFSGFTIGKGLNSTTGVQENDSQAATSDYIEVDNTLSYTISGLDNNLRSFVNAYNADNQSLGRTSATQREMVTFDSSSFIAGTPQGTGDIKYIRITQYKALDTQPDISDINNYTPILNIGSTALPYEPFGYKIPLYSNGTSLAPIYLSNQLMKIGDSIDALASSGTVTYNIVKYEITGQERWYESNGLFYFAPTNFENRSVVLCTHYPYYDGAGTSAPDKSVLTKYGGGVSIWIKDSSYATVTDFTTFLAQEYSNGTPVTVYYVAATPTTESVTAPSIPTTSGLNTIDVNTTVKPSEMILTYNGWRINKQKKKSANLFDKSTMVVPYYIAGTTWVYTATSSTSRSILLPCEPSTTYTIHLPNCKTCRIADFETAPQGGDVGFNASDVGTTSYGNKHTVHTTAANAHYIVFFVYNSSAEAQDYSESEYFSNIMICEGQYTSQTFPEYAPYWE